MHGYLVTGTDTEVGKSLVSAALLVRLAQQHPRVAGYKPVAAGCDASGHNADVDLLCGASQPPISSSDCCPYLLGSACAPHLAAQEEFRSIEAATIMAGAQALAARNDALVIEGAGGFIVPLADNPKLDSASLFQNLHQALGLPVILVVAMRLGCINHALLTVEAIRQRGLPLAGWVANSPQSEAMAYLTDNLYTLQSWIAAPYLGHIPYLGTTNSDLERAQQAANYLA